MALHAKVDETSGPAELSVNPAVSTLREFIAAGPVTLLYGARDEIHNQASALAEFLSGRGCGGP